MKKLLIVLPAMLLMFVSCEKNPEEDKGSQGQPVEFEAVDMGLSVKWGNKNIGADSPKDYGFILSWGGLEPTEDYKWETYRLCGGNGLSMTKYNTDANYGTVDNLTQLEMADDVAHVKLGGKWRMPTADDISELILTRGDDNYTWEWQQTGDKGGFLVTYLVNGNSIYLPAAGQWDWDRLREDGVKGYYWSSSLVDGYPICSYSLSFSQFQVNLMDNGRRSYGYSVRPVSD